MLTLGDKLCLFGLSDHSVSNLYRNPSMGQTPPLLSHARILRTYVTAESCFYYFDMNYVGISCLLKLTDFPLVESFLEKSKNSQEVSNRQKPN